MKPTRAAIAAIHSRMKGELSALIEQLDELSEDEARGRLAEIQGEGVWEALYTLAEAIDRR